MEIKYFKDLDKSEQENLKKELYKDKSRAKLMRLTQKGGEYWCEIFELKGMVNSQGQVLRGMERVKTKTIIFLIPYSDITTIFDNEISSHLLIRWIDHIHYS